MVFTICSGSLSLFLYKRIIQKLNSSNSTSRERHNRNRVLAVSFRLICILFLVIQLLNCFVELAVEIGHDHYMHRCFVQQTSTDKDVCLVEGWAVIETIDIANNCLWLVFGVVNSCIFIVLIRPFQLPIQKMAKMSLKCVKHIISR